MISLYLFQDICTSRFRDFFRKYTPSALTFSCGPKYRARETAFNCMRFENAGQTSVLQACSFLTGGTHRADGATKMLFGSKCGV